MKKIYIYFMMLLISGSLYAQTVEIGTGTSTGRFPLSAHFGFERSASLFTATEIGQSGNISSLAWRANSSKTTVRPIKIYLKEVTESTLVAQNWASLITGATLVYDGSSSILTGWNPFLLTNAFNYSGGTNNLLVLVETNYGAGGAGDGFDGASIRYSSATSTVLTIAADINPPTTNLTLGSNRPNIQIHFGAMATCFSPQGLNVSNLDSTSATLNWNAAVPAPANGYEIELRTDTNVGVAGPALVGTYSTGAGILTYSFSNLIPLTTYYAFVKSVCTTSESSLWSSVISFTTLCSPITAPTSNETFTSYSGAISNSSLPCWNESIGATIGGALTGTISAWTNSTYNNITAHANGNALMINLYSTKNDWIISPSIDLGTTSSPNYRLKYETSVVPWTGTANVTSLDTDKSVTLLISTDNGITWASTNILKTYEGTNIPNNGGLIEMVDLSSYTGLVKFAFFAKSTSSSQDLRFYIDNFVVEELPNCSDLFGVSYANITQNSATISWNASAPVPSSGYEYEIRTSGLPGTPGAIQTGTVASNILFKDLINLIPSTEYKVYVRTNCGTNLFGLWSLEVSFTTLCDYPTFVSATPATICGTGTTNLTANFSSGDVKWFDAAIGGNLLHTGNTFVTPQISQTTSYWVNSFVLGANQTGGKLTHHASGTTASSYGLVFNATQGFILKSVDVFLSSSTAGNVVIHLTDNIGTIIETRTIAVPAGGTEASPVQHTLQLDMNVPVGIGYRLMAVSSPSMIRDSSNNTFPYAIGNVGSITSGYLSGTSASYYYFYNWLVQSNCTAPSRTEVIATVNTPPVLTLSSTNLDICQGTTEMITVLAGATDYDSFVWSPATGVSGNQTIGWTFNPTEDTTYTLTASQTAGANCTQIITVNTAIKNTPVMLELDDEFTVCTNSIIELKVGDATAWAYNYENGFEDATDLGFVHNPVSGTTNFELSSALFSEGLSSVRLTHGSSTSSNLTISNVLNLGGLNNAYIEFDHIAALESSITGATYYVYDYGTVQYSLDGGATWTSFTPADYVGTADSGASTATVQRFTRISYAGWVTNISSSTSVPTNADWKTERFNLPANVDLSNFKVRFALTSDSSSNYNGWYIDNVKIVGDSTPEVVWQPATNLFTDAAATIPYVGGTDFSTVYFKSTTDMPATNYLVSASNNLSCISTQNFEITAVQALLPVVQAQAFCGAVSAADIVVTTQPGGVIKWYDSAVSVNEITSIATSGTYFVEQQISGCVSARASVVITINAIPATPTGSPTQVFTTNATIADLVLDQTPITWYASESDALAAINPLVATTPLVDGNSYFGVLITGGCSSLPFEVLVDITLSNDEFDKEQLKYYPNPVEDIITISYSEVITQVEVFDLLGKRVKTLQTNSNEVKLDLSNLSSGTYLVQLKTDSKQQFVKIIKR